MTRTVSTVFRTFFIGLATCIILFMCCYGIGLEIAKHFPLPHNHNLPAIARFAMLGLLGTCVAGMFVIVLCAIHAIGSLIVYLLEE